MKLRLASDLHYEFYGLEDWAELMKTFDGKEDILVLAGDVVPLRFLDQVRDVLKQFTDRYKSVVYVPGNHEFYDCDTVLASNLLEVVGKELPGLTILDNKFASVQGVPFYGGTMWFKNLPNNWKWKEELNDFHYIRRFEPWVYEKEKEFVAGLRKYAGKDTTVVTHHLPTFGSVPERYRGGGMNSLNCFFVDVMDWEIAEIQPRLWLHGHTHTACDYEAGKTRVVCNPFGYPHEMEDFPKPVIIEL